MNTATTTTTTQPPSAPPKPLKRLACDDCRARKVSCTGEESGCARCRRSGVECVYSPPKQPGRPRKIRKTEPPPPQQPKKRAFDDTGLCSEGDVAENIIASLPFPDLGAPFGAPDNGGFANFFQESEPLPPVHDIRHGMGGGYSGFENSSSAFPPFNGVATPKSMTSTLSGITMDWPADFGGPDFNFDPSALFAQNQNSPCDCLPAFFGAISQLRDAPNDADTFSLPSTLMVLRNSISVIKQATSCSHCHCSPQSAYICVMMLGTILPLLLMYIETSFSTITICASDPDKKHSIMLDYYGNPDLTVPVELASHSWEPMAKNVVYNEFTELMNLIRKIEGILQKKYQNAPPPLNAVANGEKSDNEANEVAVREMKDVTKGTSTETPLCIGMLNMIRGMARRVQIKISTHSTC